MIRALIFDLDDTLYCERDFVASGYRAVAGHVSAQCGRSCSEVYGAMMEILAREGRHGVMPAVIRLFLGPSARLDELVDVYRRHTPEIRLFAGYAALLREFRKRYRLGIITDGIPEVQERKCRALGLEEAVDKIIYTWRYGAEKGKPDPCSFRMMLSCLDVQPSDALCIGDSIDKDCCGARGAGMKCVLVQRQPAACAEETASKADFVIESLFHLPLVLKKLEDRNEAA